MYKNVDGSIAYKSKTETTNNSIKKMDKQFMIYRQILNSKMIRNSSQKSILMNFNK